MLPNSIYEHPRWSPDDRWTAFQQADPGRCFIQRVLVVSAAPGGDAREIAQSAELEGLS